MPAITRPARTLIELAQQEYHPNCFTCGPKNGHSMGLRFRLLEDGSVESPFHCQDLYQGYQGILHGGIATSILDSAMTSCLFAHGRVAVTAEMTVQFRHPIEVGKVLAVRAWITRSRSPLYVVEGELRQDGQLKAKAKGKFADKPQSFEVIQ